MCVYKFWDKVANVNMQLFFSLGNFVVVLLAFVMLGLVSSVLSQDIG